MSKKALEAKDRGNVDFAAANVNDDEAIRHEIQVAKVMTRIAKAKLAQGLASEALAWLDKASVVNHDPEIAEMIANLRLEARRPLLSVAYAPKLYALLMEIRNSANAGKRIQNLVFSSPIMSAYFIDFMKGFAVEIRDNEDIHFFDSEGLDDQKAAAIYIKKWASFVWIAPFIVQLIICDDFPDDRPSNWVYDILPRTTNVLRFFYFRVPDMIPFTLHPLVMPFLRRQLPNLQKLWGPIDIFLQLPTFSKPKTFKSVKLFVRNFPDVLNLFKTKRFTATKLELTFYPSANYFFFDFNYTSNFMEFLNNLTYRMPETEQIDFLLPIHSARFPVADLVKAFRTVFPRLSSFTITAGLYKSGTVLSFDRKRLASDYAYLIQEMRKMPKELCVNIKFEKLVKFLDRAAVLPELLRSAPPGFTFDDPSDDDSSEPYSVGYVSENVDIPVCHDNKFLRYKVLF